jgi:hypothetical protein
LRPTHRGHFLARRHAGNPRTLGDLFEVTKDEKLDYDLRNIECYDADRWEIQEALRVRKRDRNRGWMADRRREKARRKTARVVSVIPAGSNAKPIDTFSPGHRQFYAWLDGKSRQTIHDMAIAFRNDPNIGRDPTGRRIGHSATMRKLHRYADDLVEVGLVDHEYIPFRFGPKMRRVWRLDQVD